jgi:excisionase family DNA binding protein
MENKVYVVAGLYEKSTIGSAESIKHECEAASIKCAEKYIQQLELQTRYQFCRIEIRYPALFTGLETPTTSQVSARKKLTRKEAAAELGICPQTLANWASSGRVQIPFYKVGKKKVIYYKSDIDAYLEEMRRTQTV